MHHFIQPGQISGQIVWANERIFFVTLNNFEVNSLSPHCPSFVPSFTGPLKKFLTCCCRMFSGVIIERQRLVGQRWWQPFVGRVMVRWLHWSCSLACDKFSDVKNLNWTWRINFEERTVHFVTCVHCCCGEALLLLHLYHG